MLAARIGKGLCVILMIGALLHAYGSFLAFDAGSPALVWSLGSGGFAVFLSVLAFYANGFSAPKGLLAIVAAGLAAWFAIVLAFGFAIHNPADPRVLYHLVVSAALIAQLLLRARSAMHAATA